MASLYLHIPFCERKCFYCDFYSIEDRSATDRFLTALHREIDLRGEEGKGMTFDTVFFGGGTPSLLTPVQIGVILERLHSGFSIGGDAEITVEANPGTVDAGKLRGYRSLGINRVSIGIQSFDDEELRFLTRIHDSSQAIRCVEDAQKAGFRNFSIDLIYALPGQSVKQWLRTLGRAMQLEPPHISAYGLIVEPGTPLARIVGEQRIVPAGDEREAELYEATMEYLESHGYEHYEVSSYARPGYRSRHNSNYWSHGDYLGFGPSAHSFRRPPGGWTSGIRSWNVKDVAAYCDRLLGNGNPLDEREELTREELYTERIFLGLRSDGLDLDDLRKDFAANPGLDQHDLFEDLLARSLVRRTGSRVRLTPKGFLVCDEICSRVLAGRSPGGTMTGRRE